MKIKNLLMLIVLFALPIFAQVDSTYIKSLEKDYAEFSKSLTEAQKREEQIKGILIYLEDRYRKEKQKLDSLRVK